MIRIPLNQDLELMLISAMRYAIGRQTYMPSATIDFIRPLIPHLSTNTLYVMKRDVEEDVPYHAAFTKEKKIYMQDEWLALGEQILHEYDKRKITEQKDAADRVKRAL